MATKKVGNNAKTTDGGVTGKGFVKGKSGNPSGRPKLPAEFAELAKNKSIDALKRLIAIIDDDTEKTEHIIRACETVIAYGYGKPSQSVDLSSTDGSIKISVAYE